MKINIAKRPVRLETISIRDVLLFPDREETVREVDMNTGTLYTERIVRNNDEDSKEFPFNKEYPFKKEKVVYGGGLSSSLDIIHKNCFGKVYDWIKMKRLK